MMSMDKEYFYELFEAVPQSKWKEIEKHLKILAMPEEIPTQEELDAIKQGREEIANGESTLYTIDEFKRAFLND